jgi:hypothetical protein
VGKEARKGAWFLAVRSHGTLDKSKAAITDKMIRMEKNLTMRE